MKCVCMQCCALVRAHWIPQIMLQGRAGTPSWLPARQASGPHPLCPLAAPAPGHAIYCHTIPWQLLIPWLCSPSAGLPAVDRGVLRIRGACSSACAGRTALRCLPAAAPALSRQAQAGTDLPHVGGEVGTHRHSLGLLICVPILSRLPLQQAYRLSARRSDHCCHCRALCSAGTCSQVPTKVPHTAASLIFCPYLSPSQCPL